MASHPCHRNRERVSAPRSWLAGPSAVLLAFLLLTGTAAPASAQGTRSPSPGTAAVPDGAARGEVIDRVLALVAGDLILMSDVNAAIEFGLVPQTAGADPTGVVLSQLIDRALMLGEVERYAPPEPAAEVVEREVRAIRDRFGSAAAYGEALARYGIDESSLRQTLRANLRLRAYLAQRFSAVPPSDEELLRYFSANAARFFRNGEPQPFDAVRDDVLQALELDRRQMMVDDWLTGLRRRAGVTTLYRADAPGVR